MRPRKKREPQDEQRVDFHVEPGAERAHHAGPARERAIDAVQHNGEAAEHG
jgi:hypothetical protein